MYHKNHLQSVSNDVCKTYKIPGLALILFIKCLLNGSGTVDEGMYPCPRGFQVPHLKYSSIDFYLQTLLDRKRTLCPSWFSQYLKVAGLRTLFIVQQIITPYPLNYLIISRLSFFYPLIQMSSLAICHPSFGYL